MTGATCTEVTGESPGGGNTPLCNFITLLGLIVFGLQTRPSRCGDELPWRMGPYGGLLVTLGLLGACCALQICARPVRSSARLLVKAETLFGLILCCVFSKLSGALAFVCLSSLSRSHSLLVQLSSGAVCPIRLRIFSLQQNMIRKQLTPNPIKWS